MQFSEYLRQLRDESAHLSATGLRQLSGLDKAKLAELRLIWPSIAVARRRKILQLANHLAEDNVELDFDALFRASLGDPDAEVRIAAIEGLWENEERGTAEAFIRLLVADPSANVRAAAALALGRFVLLAELGKLTGPLADRTVQTLLDTYSAADQTIEVRRRALEALGYRSLPVVTSAIETAYASADPKLRVSAVYAMGRSADRRWLDVVGRELQSKDPEMRYEATRACGEIGEPVMVRPLARLLVDDDLEVRLAAVGALGEIGGPEAKRALEYCLQSDDEHVREAAAEALEELEFTEDPLDMRGILN